MEAFKRLRDFDMGCSYCYFECYVKGCRLEQILSLCQFFNNQ